MVWLLCGRVVVLGGGVEGVRGIYILGGRGVRKW